MLQLYKSFHIGVNVFKWQTQKVKLLGQEICAFQFLDIVMFSIKKYTNLCKIWVSTLISSLGQECAMWICSLLFPVFLLGFTYWFLGVLSLLRTFCGKSLSSVFAYSAIFVFFCLAKVFWFDVAGFILFFFYGFWVLL